MSVLSDGEILEEIKKGTLVIEPFEVGQIMAYGASNCKCEQDIKGVISYGLSSSGYDITLGRHFKLFEASDTIIDPKSIHEYSFRTIMLSNTQKYFIIPPHGFVLAESVEWIKMPRNVIGLCVDKSTLARCAIHLNTTIIEPEWQGIVTLEISNTAPAPAKIYCGEGIAQLIFMRTESPCICSYADKRGKYQDQAGLTLPIVK